MFLQQMKKRLYQEEPLYLVFKRIKALQSKEGEALKVIQRKKRKSNSKAVLEAKIPTQSFNTCKSSLVVIF